MVCSLAARLPVDWPESIRTLFRALDTLAQSQEVFSVDCSLGPLSKNKVFLKASAFLIAIFVRPHGIRHQPLANVGIAHSPFRALAEILSSLVPRSSRLSFRRSCG